MGNTFVKWTTIVFTRWIYDIIFIKCHPTTTAYYNYKRSTKCVKCTRTPDFITKKIAYKKRRNWHIPLKNNRLFLNNRHATTYNKALSHNKSSIRLLAVIFRKDHAISCYKQSVFVKNTPF